MVKHLRFLMLLFLVITLGGVKTWAQEVTLDFTENTWNLPTDYTTTAATYTDGTYEISFGASSDGHKFGGSYLIFGKSGATLSLPAFDFDVEKIVVVGNSGASDKVQQNFFVGDKAVSTATTGAKDTNTYEIAEAYQAAGNIYTLKVLNNKNTQVTKIEIFKKGGVTKTSTTVSFGADYDGKTISLKPGESFDAPTATLTPSGAGSLTYSSSDETVATVDATGAVTLTGTTGKTTITADFAGNDTYAASSASYTLNVAEAASLTGDGTKANPYTVADVLAIVNAGQQTSDSVYVKGIVSKIKTTADNIVKYKNCDYYLVDNEGDTVSIMAFRGKYLGNTDFTSADQLKVGDKVLVLGVLTKYYETIELDKGNYIVEFWGENTKKETSVSFGTDYDGKTINLKPGDSFTAPTATLTPAEAGTLTYSSSDEKVATVDATTGAVTLTGTTGKTTIKAAFAGNDTYAASSASYTLNVAEALQLTGDGTKENPYTVADVLAIVNAGQQTTDNVYVKGIVSKIKTTADNIVKYKNCDYYLVDNEGDTDSIMAFRGKYLGNTDFTSADQLKAGDKVLVLGVLTKYKDIIELDKDNYIVEFLGQKTATTTTFGEGIDGKTYDLKIGDTFEAPTATLTPAEAGKLAYTSSNTDVATVDATTGAVTLGKTAGTTTITAAFAGNDTYAASEASYTINLIDGSVATDSTTFDFTDPTALGHEGTSDSNGSTAGDLAEGDSFTAGKVTLTVTANGSTATRFWQGTESIDLRIYNGAKLTLAVPTGYVITKVETNPDEKDQTIGELNKQSVELDYTGTAKLKSMTVTYAVASASKDVTLTVDEFGYVTLYYSDRALIVPENTEATTYSAEFGNGLEESHRYNAGEVIPAGEAVVVYALEAGDYTFKATDATGYEDDTNMLFGTDDEQDIENDDKYYFYKLSLDNNGQNIGFYWDNESGAAFTNGAHKAYLKVSKAQAKDVKAFIINGDPTNIKAIGNGQLDVNAPLYNLAGQRVGKDYKGIVIQNGKKFVK